MSSQIVKQVEEQIKILENEKNLVEAKIRAAKDYLKLLKGEFGQGDINNGLRPNQTPEAIEKMRMAQKARQDRARAERYREMQNFLRHRSMSTTSDIAAHLNISVSTAKKYLRQCDFAESIGIDKWTLKKTF